MMTGFFMGLFVGAGVIISRYFGAKCYDRLEPRCIPICLRHGLRRFADAGWASS